MKAKCFAVGSDGTVCKIFLTFTNGYLLSMNIGYNGHNDNESKKNSGEVVHSNTAECAVKDPEGNWVTPEFFMNAEPTGYHHTSIAPHCTMQQVEAAMEKIMHMQVKKP